MWRVGVRLMFLGARERRHSRKQHHRFGRAHREASCILFDCNFDDWKNGEVWKISDIRAQTIWVVWKGLTAQNRTKKFDLNAKRIIWAPEHTSLSKKKLYNSNDLHHMVAAHEIDWLNSVRRYWSMQSFRLHQYTMCVYLRVWRGRLFWSMCSWSAKMGDLEGI